MELRTEISTAIARNHAVQSCQFQVLVKIIGVWRPSISQACLEPGDEVIYHDLVVSYLPCITSGGWRSGAYSLKEANDFRLIMES